jgi:hypothetical protein
MDIRKRASIAVIGGALSAIVGSLLAGLVVVLIRTVQGNTQSVALALAFLPMAVVFAAIPAAPFGFIAGSAGSWWLAARAECGVSKRRLYFESVGIGAILGGTFPFVLTILGWGPFNNLVSAVPISIGIGIACGIIITPLVRKYRPLPS